MSPSDAAPPLVHPVVRVLSHTHWDREWYHPAGRFRQRLVALVDELLDAPGPEPFLLDGQAIVLEDYLAARPERRADVVAALASGAIEAGPWYVLADELIPSGEALVRNLLEGREQIAALGATPPAVLYCPDSFGHPAALPDLAAGFGCPVVVLWRGYGGRRWPAGDAARWRAPSGASSLLFHLPPDGYEFGSSLPVGVADAAARWTRLRAVLEPRAVLGLLLVQNGADHHARQRQLPQAVAALAHAALPASVSSVSLGALGAELTERAAVVRLPEIAGELRDSYGYTWTLQGTFASRARQKRRNAIAERLLVRDAEPFAALAAWNATLTARARAGALGRAAWRALLACHPHDTLCGCSTDLVARAMDARLDDAMAQGCGLRDEALATLAGVDPADAREHARTRSSAIVVRNPLPRARDGLAEIELLTVLADAAVGPGSGRAAGSASLPRPRVRRRAEVAGRTVQVLSRAIVDHRIESPLHYPANAVVLRERVLMQVPLIGGLATWTTSARATPAPIARSRPTPLAVRTGRTLSSQSLWITIGRDGAVSFGNRSSDEASIVVADLLSFESVTDAGDLYTPSPRGEPVRARFLGARAHDRGPLRVSVDLRYALTLPRALDDQRPIRLTIRARLIVDAGSDVLRVDVRGRNRARDHRLRVRFGTNLPGATTVADAAFGPVVREPLVVPPEDMVAEAPPPTAPLHEYVSRYATDRGLTVISDGLAEYEAAADGAVMVTLVRAVGALSRNDLPERPGHAGWPVPTPEAQSPGPFRACFGVLLHGADSDVERVRVADTAEAFLNPLRGATLRSQPGLADVGLVERGESLGDDARTGPPALESAGVTLVGDGLAFSALKIGADPTWTVARCLNRAEQSTIGSWRFGRPLRDAMLARLDETPLSPLPVDGDAVHFTAEPRALVTVLVR